MHRMIAFLLLTGTLVLPASAGAGHLTRTLGRYTAGGAGIGALLGAGGATVSYINTQRSFDFVTGAGLGILVGAGLGYFFGVIDLATGEPQAPAEENEGIQGTPEMPPPSGRLMRPAGTFLVLGPSGASLAYSFRF